MNRLPFGIGDFLIELKEAQTTVKGDSPGHPFRGNQFEGGSGGSESGDGNERNKYSSDDRPDAKTYNTHHELIKGLEAGERSAEVAADAFNNQVESGVRNIARSGRLPKSTVTKINKMLHQQGSASEALSSSLTQQRIDRVKRNQEILDLVKANIKS